MMGIKTQARWTKSEEDILRRMGGACLPHELHLLLPRHSPLGISKKRRRLGIALSDNYSERHGTHASSFRDDNNLCKGNQSLSLDGLEPETKQLLLGSILGDGCIKRNGSYRGQKRHIFYEGHRSRQTDYVQWKCNRLTALNAKFRNADDGNCPELWTTGYTFLSELRKDIYGVGAVSTKKHIPLDVFSALDLFGLLIWYLDDGYFGQPQDSVSVRYSPSIAAKGWDADDLDALVDSLNRKLSLSLYVYRSRHKGDWNQIVKMASGDKKTLLPAWRSMFESHDIPLCMAYKVGLKEAEQK